jgi:DNA-binding response OmpR family regulator
MGSRKQTKILVVDDEPVIRDFLQAVLTEEGYTVLQAPDGRAALPLAVSEQPDLILMDIMMPHLNGIDACRRLRETPATRHIPVLILTAYNTHDRLEESIIAGADDFLGKPIDVVELRIRVRAILKVKGKRDEASRLEGYIKELQSQRRQQSTGTARAESRPA